MQTFNSAKCIALFNTDGKWVSQAHNISSVDDILNFFSPCEKSVEQINLDKYHKVYYSPDKIDSRGIMGITTDSEDERKMLTSPLLLVYCDDIQPINMTETAEKFIRDKLTLY